MGIGVAARWLSIPQPVDTTTSDDQAVNPPTQSATVKKRKPQTTATLPAGETESVEEERVALTPQEQDDVWQRIAMQFKLGIPKDPSVDAQREWFLKTQVTYKRLPVVLNLSSI